LVSRASDFRCSRPVAIHQINLSLLARRQASNRAPKYTKAMSIQASRSNFQAEAKVSQLKLCLRRRQRAAALWQRGKV
jgi:hypothetical protein